jgi:hypothetical protein
MDQINVLLINLGHGSAKSKQEQAESETSNRQNETLTFMEKTAAEHCPHLVLYQEGSSKKFLGNLRETLENNVPDSRFYLPPPSKRGNNDLIGVIINEEKLEQVTSCKGKSLDVHRAEALAALRESDLNFLTEDKRAMVVMLKEKQSKETLLVVSFHGKNQGTKLENTHKVSSEEHIEKLLRFVDEMKKRTACIHVLIGGDTNHVMETFVRTHKLDLSLLRYTVPDGFHRKQKRQIDYFLHSASLAPLGNVVPFNVAEEILDHHPLLASFQSVTVKDEARKGDTSLQAMLKLAAKVTQKAQATLKDASARLPEPGPVVAATGDIGAGGGLPELTARRKEGLLPRGGAAPLAGTVGARAYSTASSAPQGEVAFLCQLCRDKSFTTRKGLFIHFGKAVEHYPCKEEFKDETDENRKVCLCVFKTSRGLKQHQTKQAGNPGHHGAGKPFPNLKS